MKSLLLLLLMLGLNYYALCDDVKDDCRITLESIKFTQVQAVEATNLWYELDLAFSVTNVANRTIDIEVGQIGTLARSFSYFTWPSGTPIKTRGELVVPKYDNRLAASIRPGKSFLFDYSYKCNVDELLKESKWKYSIRYESWGIAKGKWFLEWGVSGCGLVDLKPRK